MTWPARTIYQFITDTRVVKFQISKRQQKNFFPGSGGGFPSQIPGCKNPEIGNRAPEVINFNKERNVRIRSGNPEIGNRKRLLRGLPGI